MAKPTPATALVKDAFDPAFTRGQVEWALWFHDPQNAKRKPTRAFKTRVKHLLEFDRGEPPARTLAFSDEPPGGRGEHSLFSTFDALMLAAALGFLSLGFKRKEIVTHLRARRTPLRRGWGPILDQRLKQAVLEISLKAPAAPANMGRILLHTASMDDAPETLRLLREVPFFSTPAEILKSLNEAGPRLIILDLSESFHRLPLALLKAPLRRRGRS